MMGCSSSDQGLPLDDAHCNGGWKTSLQFDETHCHVNASSEKYGSLLFNLGDVQGRLEGAGL